MQESKMKLWILRPLDKLKKKDNPWEPWYDKAFGFVVIAASESEAREMAHNRAGDENCLGVDPWKDQRYSSCTELTADEAPGVVIRDFASA